MALAMPVSCMFVPPYSFHVRVGKQKAQLIKTQQSLYFYELGLLTFYRRSIRYHKAKRLIAAVKAPAGGRLMLTVLPVPVGYNNDLARRTQCA
jgi:hypothetical protein